MTTKKQVMIIVKQERMIVHIDHRTQFENEANTIILFTFKL